MLYAVLLHVQLQTRAVRTWLAAVSPPLRRMEAEAAAATPAAPIPVETVYRTLEAALSFDNATRSAAERQLRDWEGDAAPGFIGSLLKVVAEVAAVPEVRGWVKLLGQHVRAPMWHGLPA